MRPHVMDVDVKIPVVCATSGLEFVLCVTKMGYIPDSPGSGPSYSCAGEPPEAAEAYVVEGYVELAGDVFDIKDMTSVDMDVIMLLTNDNQELFDTLYDENEELVYERLLEEVQNDSNYNDYDPREATYSACASILD